MAIWRRALLFAGLATGTASLAHAAKQATAHEPVTDGDTLELVQVVFRHGARTPLSKRYWPELVSAWDVCGRLYEPVPIDIRGEDGQRSRPINEHDAAQVSTVFSGGCHKGELTKQGQAQALDYGEWLRQRYIEEYAFLPKEYVAGILGSRTTNYSRTIATLAGVLTGLYPGTTEAIPVMTTEEMDEILFGNPESCRKLKFLINKLASESRSVLQTGEEDGSNGLMQRIRDALKLGPDKKIHFLDLHDAMTTMLAHGKPIPDGLKDSELLQYIERQAAARFMEYVVGSKTAGGTGEVLRLGMGRLMHLIVERMEKAARGENTENPGTKLFLYSGHDSTIMPLLAAIGQEVNHWPPYVSNIIFELWKSSPAGEHYVRILYNRNALDTSKVCGGGDKCSLRALRHKVLAPYMLTRQQREAECLMHFTHDEPAGEHVKEVPVTIGSSITEE